MNTVESMGTLRGYFPLELAAFTFLFIGLWAYRRFELINLSKQQLWYACFCRRVIALRARSSQIPSGVRDLIEMLTLIPLDSVSVRRVVFEILIRQSNDQITHRKLVQTLRTLPPP